MDTGTGLNNESWRPRKTIIVYALVFSLAFAALVGRLVYIQLHDQQKLQAMAYRQQTARREIAPFRGPIVDRHFRPLALDVECYSIFADPFLINQEALADDGRGGLQRREAVATGSQPTAADGRAVTSGSLVSAALEATSEAESRVAGRIREISLALAPVLEMPAEEIGQLIVSRADTRFVWLKRRVDRATYQRVRALKIRGIGIEPENKRHYPSGALAAQIVGTVGIDNQGVSALEYYLDSRLRGEAGHYLAKLDGRRRQVWVRPGDYHGAQDGQIVVLTIDVTIQSFVEQALAETVEHFRARGGSAIVMDPQTGEVLAMANYPSFDPYQFAESDAYARRNRQLTDPIEPGSTIKPIIASLALESGKVRLGETIFCHNGSWRVTGRTIRDTSSYGNLTFQQGIWKSSNIMMATLGLRMGNDLLYEGLTDFGFGRQTGILMPGEAPGLVYRPQRWTRQSTTSIPMGYEMLATPLQLVTAYSTFANGGRLLKPRIIRQVCSADGAVVADLSQPVEVGRPISEATADTMRQILRGVVTDGTAKRAEIPGYEPFGKTGTARKRNPDGRGYSRELYVGSFIAGAPLDNPRLICMVMIDEPDRRVAYYGSSVAGPAVKQILERSLAYLRIPPKQQLQVVHSGDH